MLELILILSLHQVSYYCTIVLVLDFPKITTEHSPNSLVSFVSVIFETKTAGSNTFSLIVFILLILTYVINSYKRYYRFRYEEITNSSIELHKEKKHHQQYADYLLRLEAILLFTIMVTILVGFYYYYN